jgi:hypothetical protein
LNAIEGIQTNDENNNITINVSDDDSTKGGKFYITLTDTGKGVS